MDESDDLRSNIQSCGQFTKMLLPTLNVLHRSRIRTRPIRRRLYAHRKEGNQFKPFIWKQMCVCFYTYSTYRIFSTFKEKMHIDFSRLVKTCPRMHTNLFKLRRSSRSKWIMFIFSDCFCFTALYALYWCTTTRRGKGLWARAPVETVVYCRVSSLSSYSSEFWDQCSSVLSTAQQARTHGYAGVVGLSDLLRETSGLLLKYMLFFYFLLNSEIQTWLLACFCTE